MPTGRVAYPDFFKKSTEEWWIDEITKHWDSLSIDGIWIVIISKVINSFKKIEIDLRI